MSHIKSEYIKVSPKPKPKISYPYMGIAVKTGTIVLFSAEGTGVVVKQGWSHGDPIGFHYDKWIESYFSPINGEVTLTQEWDND